MRCGRSVKRRHGGLLPPPKPLTVLWPPVLGVCVPRPRPPACVWHWGVWVCVRPFTSDRFLDSPPPQPPISHPENHLRNGCVRRRARKPHQVRIGTGWALGAPTRGVGRSAHFPKPRPTTTFDMHIYETTWRTDPGGGGGGWWRRSYISHYTTIKTHKHTFLKHFKNKIARFKQFNELQKLLYLLLDRMID